MMTTGASQVSTKDSRCGTGLLPLLDEIALRLLLAMSTISSECVYWRALGQGMRVVGRNEADEPCRDDLAGVIARAGMRPRELAR